MLKSKERITTLNLGSGELEMKECSFKDSVSKQGDNGDGIASGTMKDSGFKFDLGNGNKKFRPLFNMKKLYVYECDAPGCDEVYAVTRQPLSCPYCDSSAIYDEPIYIINDDINAE